MFNLGLNRFRGLGIEIGLTWANWNWSAFHAKVCGFCPTGTGQCCCQNGMPRCCRRMTPAWPPWLLGRPGDRAGSLSPGKCWCFSTRWPVYGIFVCVCVPRMENQQKKACVIQEWSHAKLLVGDLCRGFYYRKIISGRIDSIHPGISRYMNIALVQACSMGTLIVVQASPVFFSCVCVWLGTTLYQLLGTNQMYGFPCAMIGPTRP